jgi:hypothetical protein
MVDKTKHLTQPELIPTVPWEDLYSDGQADDPQYWKELNKKLDEALKKLDIPLKICYSVIVRLREKEFLIIGAPPSVGGGGPARPPRERNFYINETKIQNCFTSTLSKGMLWKKLI